MRHQWDRVAAVVAKTGIVKCVWLGEVIGQGNGVEKRTLGVGGVLGSQHKDGLETVRAASRDDQDAETIGIVVVLENVVKLDLLLPRIGVLVRPDTLSTAIKLDEEVELLAAGRVQFKGTIGTKKNIGADAKLERVLAVEMYQAYGPPASGDKGMDDEVGQAVRVVMVPNGYFGEVPLGGRNGMLAVEEPKAEGRQPVIVRRTAPVGDGIGPGAHPVGLAELVKTVLDAAGTREWLP